MSKSVMVVDDDPDIREMFRQFLTLAGFRVTVAKNGQDALRQVQSALPDVMLLDVMMPLMDGVSTCRELRGRVETANLPIIMLSGKNHKQAIDEGMNAGANRYLPKLVEFPELVRHIHEVVSERSQYAH